MSDNYVPDEFGKLDLVLFATTANVHLYCYPQTGSWRASVTMDGHVLEGFGGRPWTAVHALLLNCVNRSE